MTSFIPLEQYMKEIEMKLVDSFSTSVPETWNIPASLRDSMEYSLLAGGKRLRPLLVIAAAEAIGGQREAAIPIAQAVEMIHTYSLIHDDLPAMDNDDFRRGKPTNHNVFGEAMAILAGDGLLTHAFHQIVQASRLHNVPAEATLDIIEELAIFAGPSGMVGGQVADMQGEQGITDLETLQYIHQHKTGDLIVFSLKAGGRVSGASEAQLAALAKFGQCIGLAFQIRDDILDLVGDEGKLGKKVQSDVKQEKVTYPYFIGLEASQAELERLTLAAKEAVSDGSIPFPERLLQIADFLTHRDH